MDLRSLQKNNIEEGQSKNLSLQTSVISKVFNDKIAKHCYKPDKITLVEKVNDAYKISYYDIDNFDYRIIQNKSNLTHAIIPEGIKRIRSNTFTNCYNLVNIFMPNSIESIGNNCFSQCTDLIHFACPKNLFSIQKNAFSHCENLKIININDGLQEILAKAFEYCYSLEKISIPDSIKTIGDEAFAYCTRLKYLSLPDHITEINRGCFRYCSSLENITLPKQLETIKSRGFESCTSLKTINMPSSVSKIESMAFNNCTDLTSAVLSPNIEVLENGTFEGCFHLKKVVLPTKLTQIKKACFFSTGIKEIELPNTLQIIENNAFTNSLLTSLNIPKSVNYVGEDAFALCNLKEVIINGNTEFDFGCFDNTALFYIVYDGDKKILCNKLPNTNCKYIKVPNDIKKNFLFNNAINFDYETNQKLLELYNKTGIIFTYKFVKNLINANQLDKVLTNYKSLKFYNKIFSNLPKKTKETQLYNLEKFCTILGLFESPNTYQTLKGNTYDYDFATCAYNFFHNYFLNDNFKNLFSYINGLNYREFNPQLARFLMQKTQRKKSITEHTAFGIEPTSNFNKILISLKENNSFLIKICNNFEVLQQYNQKNKGAHQTLSPNIDTYKELLKDITYNGVTSENQYIANFLNDFSASQELFDTSVMLYNNLKENNFSHHILKEPLTKTIFYEDINKSLTYDWLDKYDLDNLILGLHTSSCGSIKNEFGIGIVKANYLYQNIQNLVIRDNNNNIIAKSTMYVNEALGYGIFNTFMMYNDIPKNMYDDIFNCFMCGVRDFACAYNKKHPDKPLKQINMGQSRNKLNEQFSQNYPLSDLMLNSIDFASLLNFPSFALINDWELNQYVIWRNNNIQKKPRAIGITHKEDKELNL